MGTQREVREGTNPDELLVDEGFNAFLGGIIQKKFGLDERIGRMACFIRRGWQTAGPDCTASPHGHQSGAPSCGQIDRWPIGPVGSRTTPALSAASAGSVPFFHLANRGARVSRTPYLTGIRRPAAGATALRFAKVGLAWDDGDHRRGATGLVPFLVPTIATGVISARRGAARSGRSRRAR